MRTLWTLFAATSLALSLTAAEPMTDGQRMAKLMGTPITLYPNHDVQGSRLVGFFNEHARESDAVVVSFTDALKGSFRVEKLKLTRGEVWIYVQSPVDISNAYRRNFAGAKGVVYVPPARAGGRGALRILGGSTRELSETAARNGLRYVAGLEEPDLRLHANVEAIAQHAQIVTLYLPSKLTAGGKAFRERFGKMVQEIRRTNPTAQIELALATGRTPEATKALAGLAYANIDLADRLAIFCEDTPDSYSSLEKLFSVFRPR